MLPSTVKNTSKQQVTVKTLLRSHLPNRSLTKAGPLQWWGLSGEFVCVFVCSTLMPRESNSVCRYTHV